MITFRMVDSEAARKYGPLSGGVAKVQRAGVTFMLQEGLFLPEGVAVLNTLASAVVRRGGWFHWYDGEIVELGAPHTEAPLGNGARIRS